MKHYVYEITLENGAKGLFIDMPDATVMSLEFNFRAGEYLVERNIWEAPHIMEHLLLGANKQIPKSREFQAEFEKNGAYCNASTGIHDIIYEAECADFEWNRILDLLITAITEPLFLESEFKAEVGNVREELTARSNNHFRHLSIALREKYGFISVTDQERLKLMANVTLDDIKDHYKNTHTSSNMRFVVAGKMPQSRRIKIKSQLEDIKLPKGRGRKALPLEVPKTLDNPLIIRNKTVDNYYFYFDTFLKERMSDEELAAMGLLNGMLTETLYSRILGTAREKGLVYHMSSGIGYDQATTNWWFGAQVRPDNAPVLFDIMTSQLQEIFDGKLTKEEIDAAKQRRLGGYQRGYQTVGSLANYYSSQYFFDDRFIDYSILPNWTKSVTKTQITEGAVRLFGDKVWGLGVLGNPKPGEVEELVTKLNTLW